MLMVEMYAKGNGQQKIMWSDETKFHLYGVVNQNNCKYWRRESPGITCEKSAISPGVSVWGGSWNNAIIRPVFFDINVNG